MKKFFIVLAVALAAVSPSFGWGRVGHATVAKIAADHLTDNARKVLKEYLGDDTTVSIASDADVFRPVWVIDLGFIPTNPGDARVTWLKKFDFSTPLNISPVSHSVTVDKDFAALRTDNLNGAYVNNAAYYVAQYAKELKEGAATMDPAMRKRKISIIVHMLGDMHCPMHIVYLDRDPVKGGFKVTINGKETSLHKWWDGGIFSAEGYTSFVDVAYLADTRTEEEIREITRGDIFDWVHETAVDSWPAHQIKEGDEKDVSYSSEMRPILLKQLRNGGYRLAALLNSIFE